MKTKTLISCTFTTQLICVFVFRVCKKNRFSQDTTHISQVEKKQRKRRRHSDGEEGESSQEEEEVGEEGASQQKKQ